MHLTESTASKAERKDGRREASVNNAGETASKPPRETEGVQLAVKPKDTGKT